MTLFLLPVPISDNIMFSMLRTYLINNIKPSVTVDLTLMGGFPWQDREAWKLCNIILVSVSSCGEHRSSCMVCLIEDPSSLVNKVHLLLYDKYRFLPCK